MLPISSVLSHLLKAITLMYYQSETQCQTLRLILVFYHFINEVCSISSIKHSVSYYPAPAPDKLSLPSKQVRANVISHSKNGIFNLRPPHVAVKLD